ncbi:hypothetical protein LY78DRAFT_335627 [Colletotrichum sublineola]|nr:hypothetical protein LY78DRAFT_335627 [Colletotrichum sublineola]
MERKRRNMAPPPPRETVGKVILSTSSLSHLPAPGAGKVVRRESFQFSWEHRHIHTQSTAPRS